MRTGSYRSLGPHGFHRLVYSDWGDAGNARVCICVHGISRNGRDFDARAREYRFVRGEHSDVLLDDTAREMTRRGPRAEFVTMPRVGHAPMLTSADQIALVRDWIAG